MSDVEDFLKMDLPISEYHKNIQESNVGDVEKWLKSYVLLYATETEKVVLIRDLFSAFTQWCESNNCKYIITSKKFSLELSNLQFSGVYKGSHTKYGDTKIIKILELKKYYGIGCLVDVCTADTDEEY
jgi:hypothetical protein